MRMLDGNADGDLAGSRFVERIAVGIAALIDCGAGSVANTGQHRGPCVRTGNKAGYRNLRPNAMPG